jgi:hypothetical protein
MAINTAISILNTTLRVIGVDLSELNFREYDARKSLKELLYAVPCESRDLNDSRNIRLSSPVRSFFNTDFATI